MSIPKEPRQIMINLMYLVLTAMLALNVSSEILHAFKIINASIGKSNQSIDQKNFETLTAFQANEQMEGARDRVKPFNDKAKLVHAEATKVFEYLEEWKKKVIAESGGYEKTAESDSSIKKEDNIDASTLLLVEQKGGDEVKKKLLDLRNFMLNQISDTARSYIDKQLPLQIVNPPASDNNPQGDWATGTFFYMPTLAAITLFAKLQNDVRNSEALIIDELFNEANAMQVKFDAITAIAVPTTSYAMQGQKVGAQIMLAAYNKSVNPHVVPNTGSIMKTEGGVAYWEANAAGVGVQTVHGTLTFNAGPNVINKDWKFDYVVGSAGASMQLDKMNVFYIGVPNPITVTAAGYSLEDVSVSIPGAQMTSTGKGKYDVMVTQAMAPKVTTSINAKTAQGIKTVGTMEVRIKRIPDPIAKLGGKANSFTMPANVFRAQIGIVAVLENFDFDARYVVTSFDFSYQQRRKDYQGPFHVNGPVFAGAGVPSEVSKYQSTLAAPGDRVYIENIKAVGPDKTTRSLGPLIIILN